MSCDLCGGCDCDDRGYVYGHDNFNGTRTCAMVMGGKSIIGSAISDWAFVTAFQNGTQNNIVVCQKRACGDVANNDFRHACISSTEPAVFVLDTLWLRLVGGRGGNEMGLNRALCLFMGPADEGKL